MPSHPQLKMRFHQVIIQHELNTRIKHTNIIYDTADFIGITYLQGSTEVGWRIASNTTNRFCFTYYAYP